MNVNELANVLEELHEQDKSDGVGHLAMPEAATMLRQQQAEIEALKKEAALQRLSDFTQEADNKPVAWMSNGKEFYVQKNYCPDFIPLYTHPVKALTDEEIVSLINKHIDYVPDGDGMKLVGVMDFARAILRKAQEK